MTSPWARGRGNIYAHIHRRGVAIGGKGLVALMVRVWVWVRVRGWARVRVSTRVTD